MNGLFRQLQQQIKKSKNILLTTHPGHDGDALGSLVAMVDLLVSQHKSFTAWLHEEASTAFNFLPHLNKLSIGLQPDLTKFDTLLILDAPDINRANVDFSGYDVSIFTAVIDHHPANSLITDLNIVSTQAASTTQLIFDLFDYLNYQFDKYTATALLCGMAADTENFSNSATNPKVIKQASQLLRQGANLNLITKKFFDNKKINTLKLLGQLLNNLHYNPKLGLVSAVITQKDLLEFNLDEGALTNVSNFLKNIKEGEITLVLKETLDGKIKGSLRSKTLNIEPLARALGGGGHARAAGFMLEGKLIKTENGGWLVE